MAYEQPLFMSSLLFTSCFHLLKKGRREFEKIQGHYITALSRGQKTYSICMLGFHRKIGWERPCHSHLTLIIFAERLLLLIMLQAKYEVQFNEHAYRNTFTYTEWQAHIPAFQTEVLKISGPRRDKAVHDLVMTEGLCNTTIMLYSWN
jgi:hypothetical protein